MALTIPSESKLIRNVILLLSYKSMPYKCLSGMPDEVHIVVAYRAASSPTLFAVKKKCMETSEIFRYD